MIIYLHQQVSDEVLHDLARPLLPLAPARACGATQGVHALQAAAAAASSGPSLRSFQRLAGLRCTRRTAAKVSVIGAVRGRACTGGVWAGAAAARPAWSMRL